jgi:hypothetical protein
MNSRKEFYIESRDSWQKSAHHDIKQFLSSLAMAATGLTLASVSVGTNGR